MDEQVARTIRNISTLEGLAQLEKNAERLKSYSDKIRFAVDARTIELGRALVAKRTGLQVTDLSPAEEKIIEAVSRYVGIKRRQGRDATRTFMQLENRGLIESAEASVTKKKPTQGFEALVAENLSDLSFEQIIVDHPEEFSTRALWYARRTLGLSNDETRPPSRAQSDVTKEGGTRNPSWTTDELVLALDLYLTNPRSPPSKTSAEVAELSSFLGRLGQLGRAIEAQTYRNANSVYMKMMNFRRFDPAFTDDGRVGLTRGNKEEGTVWNEYGNNHTALTARVASIRKRVEDAGIAEGGTSVPREAPYWIFVCNPKKWAIDRFLDTRIERDSWGVRKSDADKFAPGQLGLIRVGVDQRNAEERKGKPKLDAGIYALCEIESIAEPGTGANDGYWAEGGEREPGWPTVRIRYLRTYIDSPLKIERMRAEKPDLSPWLLNGLQAASFPISEDDFRAVLDLLNEEPDDLPITPIHLDIDWAELARLEKKYLNASPHVKTRLSKSIERGKVGSFVKKAMGFRCQVCEALGSNPLGFTKPNGELYAEAHHVMPVSTGQVGSLSAANIIVVCANHHRQMHYGGIHVSIEATGFQFDIDGAKISVPRFAGPAKEHQPMWVFGYGSLMWDGWQAKHGGGAGVMATLVGYNRIFNKASTRNWGSNSTPGPTLNLIAAAEGACTGFAFEFADSVKAAILTDLKAREGLNFELRNMSIRLVDGRVVDAFTPIYVGSNLIGVVDTATLAQMALAAKGRDGNCADYVLSIGAQLAALGIKDAAVEGLTQAVEEGRSAH